MMKNRHLSKQFASQKFYEFRTKLQAKCNENGIELRVVDRWYPSSKTCHCCGTVKKDLKLSDRMFKCSLPLCRDRDLNAALNLGRCNDLRNCINKKSAERRYVPKLFQEI